MKVFVGRDVLLATNRSIVLLIWTTIWIQKLLSGIFITAEFIFILFIMKSYAIKRQMKVKCGVLGHLYKNFGVICSLQLLFVCLWALES